MRITWFYHTVFFVGPVGNRQNDDSRPRCAKRERKDSVKLLLTKYSAHSFNCPRSKVSRLNGTRGPGGQLARYRPPVADYSLAFFKEVGPSSGVTPSLLRLHKQVWWADASRKRTSSVRARRKPPCPAWSERHEWLHRIAPRIIETHKAYHDDNVNAEWFYHCYFLTRFFFILIFL